MDELRDWCSKTIVASYPIRERPSVWQGVLRYLDWLKSLPIGPGGID